LPIGQVVNALSTRTPSDPRHQPLITGASGLLCTIVINYYGAYKTERCLASLFGQAIDTLVLVDNSADEDERHRLEAILSSLKDRRCRFIIKTRFNDTNLGFGKAINQVIRDDQKSTGGHDYYLLINNDAEATPGLVAGLMRAAATHPNAALVSPHIRWGDGDLGYYWYQPFLGHVSRLPWLGSFSYLSGCCLLVDAELAPNGALFDEDFFMYGEDIDLTARAVRAGRAIVCVDDLLVIHEGSGSSRHGGLFYEYHVARGHVLLAGKLADHRATRILFTAGRALYLTARAMVRSLRYRRGTPIRALLLAWTGRAVNTPLESATSHDKTSTTSFSSANPTNR
jgi:N-acetylglucosaminyl-diphospho-decaprenol L-rhamnosyltransferase